MEGLVIRMTLPKVAAKNDPPESTRPVGVRGRRGTAVRRTTHCTVVVFAEAEIEGAGASPSTRGGDDNG
jgi:hypothetical protein